MKKNFFLFFLSLQLVLSPLALGSGFNDPKLRPPKLMRSAISPLRFITGLSDLLQQSPAERSLSEVIEHIDGLAKKENIILSNDSEKNLDLLFQAGILSPEELLQAKKMKSSLERFGWNPRWSISRAYFESLKQTPLASLGIVLPTAGFVLLVIWALSTAQELSQKKPQPIDCPDERTHVFQNQCVPNDVGMPDERNPMFF